MKLTCVVEEVYYQTKEEKRKALYEKHKDKMLEKTRERRKDPEYRAKENKMNLEYYYRNREARLKYAREYRLKKKLQESGLVQL